MKKTIFTLLLAITASVGANATILWEETFDKNGSNVVEKNGSGYWPYAGGDPSKNYVFQNYSTDYTSATSYNCTVRQKKLNGEASNTPGFYFGYAKPAAQCFLTLEYDFVAEGNGKSLLFEVSSDQAIYDADLSKMTVKVNDEALEIPAITFPEKNTTTTISIPLPAGEIKKIHWEFDNLGQHVFVSRPRIIDHYYYYRGYVDGADIETYIEGINGFTNGVASFSCSQKSYLFVVYQVVGNPGVEYACNQYTEESAAHHATLYQAPTPFEKMGFEPGDYTLYLYDNEDGTLELSTVVLPGKRLVDTDYIIPQVTITTQSADESKGSTSGDGIVAENTSVEITAVPNYGYHFTQWSDGVIDNPRTVVVTQDTTFTAEFAPNEYTISVTSEDESLGRVTGGGIYTYGSVAELTAVPETGFQFNGWSDGNMENPRHVSVLGNAEYIALFGTKMCKLTIKPNDIMGGAVFGAGTFEFGTQVEISARANSGYQFIKWSNGETYNPYIFTIIDDLELTAFFQKTQADIVDAEEVEVTPEENEATIIWPQVDNSYTYTLIIWADAAQSEKICTLTFDAQGRLTGIDFSKKANHSAYTQTEQVAGFAFTVTGLEADTEYFFNIIATDENGEELQTEEGSFKTIAAIVTGIGNVSGEKVAEKILRDGVLYIQHNGRIYTTSGTEVK